MSMMSAGLSVIGGLVQGIGAMQAHEAQARADEYNAAVAKRNQGIIAEQTEATISDQIEANRRDLSKIRGDFAANGISWTGSATDVMMDTMKAQTLGIQRQRYAGQLQEVEQIDKQNLALMGAADEKAAGSISLISGILGGVSGAVSGLSRTA